MISGRLAMVCAVALLYGCREAPSRIVHVAVAANFAGVQNELAQRFTQQTGDTVRPSVGATGQLYAQIKNGAPFDVFLSADAERPRLLEEEGLAANDARFTYAIGQLVLYAPRRDSSSAAGPELLKSKFTHIAIANPAIAPYGAAALETIKRLSADSAVAGKVVQGESLTQTLQFVTSGAADLGFVALSQVLKEPAHTYWVVPREYHNEIVQDAVLLRTAENNPPARAYLEFLRSAEAQAIIKAHGYAVPTTQ
jgi:molybdate transport system substrate-binding protein